MLEYASPVWHTSLTADETKTLEAVQRRACHIITYTENSPLLRLENLDRRDWQSGKLLRQITSRSGHRLHHLLPVKRDETVTSHL